MDQKTDQKNDTQDGALSLEDIKLVNNFAGHLQVPAPLKPENTKVLPSLERKIDESVDGNNHLSNRTKRSARNHNGNVPNEGGVLYRSGEVPVTTYKPVREFPVGGERVEEVSSKRFESPEEINEALLDGSDSSLNRRKLEEDEEQLEVEARVVRSGEEGSVESDELETTHKVTGSFHEGKTISETPHLSYKALPRTPVPKIHKQQVINEAEITDATVPYKISPRASSRQAETHKTLDKPFLGPQITDTTLPLKKNPHNAPPRTTPPEIKTHPPLFQGETNVKTLPVGINPYRASPRTTADERHEKPFNADQVRPHNFLRPKPLVQNHRVKTILNDPSEQQLAPKQHNFKLSTPTVIINNVPQQTEELNQEIYKSPYAYNDRDKVYKYIHSFNKFDQKENPPTNKDVNQRNQENLASTTRESPSRKNNGNLENTQHYTGSSSPNALTGKLVDERFINKQGEEAGNIPKETLGGKESIQHYTGTYSPTVVTGELVDTLTSVEVEESRPRHVNAAEAKGALSVTKYKEEKIINPVETSTDENQERKKEQSADEIDNLEDDVEESEEEYPKHVQESETNNEKHVEENLEKEENRKAISEEEDKYIDDESDDENKRINLEGNEGHAREVEENEHFEKTDSDRNTEVVTNLKRTGDEIQLESHGKTNLNNADVNSTETEPQPKLVEAKKEQDEIPKDFESHLVNLDLSADFFFDDKKNDESGEKYVFPSVKAKNDHKSIFFDDTLSRQFDFNDKLRSEIVYPGEDVAYEAERKKAVDGYGVSKDEDFSNAHKPYNIELRFASEESEEELNEQDDVDTGTDKMKLEKEEEEDSGESAESNILFVLKKQENYRRPSQKVYTYVPLPAESKVHGDSENQETGLDEHKNYEAVEKFDEAEVKEEEKKLDKIEVRNEDKEETRTDEQESRQNEDELKEDKDEEKFDEVEVKEEEKFLDKVEVRNEDKEETRTDEEESRQNDDELQEDKDGKENQKQYENEQENPQLEKEINESNEKTEEHTQDKEENYNNEDVAEVLQKILAKKDSYSGQEDLKKDPTDYHTFWTLEYKSRK